jgi:hypothetical protein
MAFVHGKDAEVLMDALAMTGYLRGFEAGSEVELSDTTVLGDEGHKNIPGLDNGSLSFDGVWDATPGAGGMDVTVEGLKQAASASVITLAPNGLTVPNRVISVSARLNNYAIPAAVADAVGFSAGWATDGQVDNGKSHKELASVSATTNGTSVDNAAGTTTGGVGALHVTANTRNGNVTVKIQHSTDNSAWSDLLTFTVVSSSTTTAERVAVTGTVNRYTRAQWTVGGSTGALTIAVAFSRR